MTNAARKRRPRSASVHYLHGNTRPLVAKEARGKLEQLGWCTVPHQPPADIALPSPYYHLFRPLKAFQMMKKITKIKKVERAVSELF